MLIQFANDSIKKDYSAKGSLWKKEGRQSEKNPLSFLIIILLGKGNKKALEKTRGLSTFHLYPFHK